MQKYIAVVNPRMDKDDISRLIAKDVAGALFEISHQNYPVAAKLIAQIKDLSRKYNKPVSLIQDASNMLDPLDLEFGERNGIDWVVLANVDHWKAAQKLGRKIPVIWKGSSLPKNVPVDSIMDKSLPDADAAVENIAQIKHGFKPHVKQNILETIRIMGDEADSAAIAVSDLDAAKAFSAMRPRQQIIFTPTDRNQAPVASILWGVRPMFAGRDLASDLKNRSLLKKGQRYVDARDLKHVTINFLT